MNKRWYIYVLAIALAITGLVVLSPTRIAQAAGGDGGAVSVYVYHDVNEDGIWNWGYVVPPNLRGDYAWRWDFPCIYPASVCETAEIGLVGAEVALKYYGSETRVGKTFHDGPAEFGVPLGTQVVGVQFLGAGDGRHWRVTNVSQKTVNEPAASQFAFNFPLPPTGPNSMHVILIGVAEVAQVAPPCSSTQTQAAATTVAATTAATTTVDAAPSSGFLPLKTDAYVQIAHLAPFAMDPGTAVTVTVDGVPVVPNFAYGDLTEYLPILEGEYEVGILPEGSSEPAITATVELMGDMYYTAIAYGDGVNQDLELMVLEDDLAEPEAGKFHLRLGHLAPFASGDATADIRLADGKSILENVSFGDVSGYIPLDAGEYDIIITTPGGETTLIDPLPVSFTEGEIVSVFATGDGVNQDLGVFAMPAGEVGDLLPVRHEAYVQIAHLAPFAMDPGTAVTVTLDGVPVVPNFAYGDLTEYLPILKGEYEVGIVPEGSTEPAITATVELMGDMYYTAIAYGDGVNQDLGLMVLEDDLAEPEAGKFHLRLGHLAPFASGDATADIRLADGKSILENVSFGDVSGYIPLDAGEYDIIITTPGGETTLIDPLPVSFTEGEIVSVFATGDGVNQDLGVFVMPAGEVDGECEVPAATTYTIQPGDTLTSIARAFGTTVQALASANCIANPNLIYAGAVITVP